MSHAFRHPGTRPFVRTTMHAVALLVAMAAEGELCAAYV